jgi:energy-coupling factor transport system permease protein
MHPLVWFTWAAGLMLVTLTTRNPVYLAVVLAVTRLVHALAAEPGAQQGGLSVARFAAAVIPLSAILNALTIHLGDTVLFVIPGNLPMLSGPVTLESLAFGAINGLMLTAVLSIFGALNSAVAPRAWMRFAPRAYQSIAMTASIALGFAPQMALRLREVRDAQAIRGHRVKGVRDWLPLWMPLLTGSLEQSMQVSEAMVARGYGAVRSERAPARAQALMALGLGLALLGWLAQFVPGLGDATSSAALVLGAVCAVFALRMGATKAVYTTYRAQRWTARDVLAVLVCGAAACALLAAPALGRAPSLHYSPYPALTLPNVQVWVCLALLAFAAPGVLTRGAGQDGCG